MIDCHTHILPGVDDGPDTLDEALAMARLAVAEGITHMIATPHYLPHRYDQQRVRPAYEALTAALEAEQLPLRLTLGNEAALDEEGLKAFADGICLPLGASGHALVELPYDRMYPVHEQWLYQLSLNGLVPVLAHVDRYPYLMAEPDKLRRMLITGCVSQMNASAILRQETRKPALAMIRSDLVHVVASDCHSLQNRPPALKAAFELVADEVGRPMAEDLFRDNGRRLLERQPLVRQWPQKAAERKGWLKWMGRLRVSPAKSTY